LPESGAEVFSLIRESALPPEEYLTRHFVAGTERERISDDDAPGSCQFGPGASAGQGDEMCATTTAFVEQR
jgi:hypothetical protein